MDDNEKTKNLVSRGAELVGAAVGGAIGFYAGGPIGAVIGGVAGPVIAWSLQKIGVEFSSRWLSPREEVRVGAGLVFAYNKITQLLEEGCILRNDNFFKQDATGRSASEEILEGVILKCKNEPEEKKCKYIAYIYANVAFRPDISAQSANYLLHLAEQLTYRQLCLIALAKRAKEISLEFAWGKYLTSTRLREHPDPSFVAEQRHLPSGLVHAMGNTEEPPFLESLGQLCYETMSLEEIPIEDLREVVDLIKGEKI
ncbi:MAG: hypothetical protein JW963_08645 [Anaerolineales bacterium]|nr:hypothetical protein [Anaerolineales bacterium]